MSGMDAEGAGFNGLMASCFGKEAFDSPALAHGISRRRQKRGKRVNVYRCQHCGSWHMGTPKRRRGRK